MPSFDIKASLNASARTLKQPLGLSFLLLFLPSFVCFVHDYFEKSGDLACLVALRLAVAQMLMQGRELYTDFFEWTQPVIFEFGKIVYLLQSLLGPVLALRAETITKLLLSSVLFASGLICFYLLVSARRQIATKDPDGDMTTFDLTGAAYMAALIVFAFFMRLQTGELQWYLAVVLAPWLLLKHFRYNYSALTFARPVTLLLGLAAGVMCMSDLPHPIIFLVLELYFIYQSRSVMAPLKHSESLGFTLALLGVGVHFLLLPEEVKHAYINWVVPIRVMSWGSFDEAINGLGASPDQTKIYYLGSLALFMAVALGPRCKQLNPLALTTLAGFALNLLEKQSFTRDVILITYGAIAILIIAIVLGAQMAGQFVLPRVPARANWLKLFMPRLGFITLTLLVLAAVPLLLRRSDRAYGEAINPHPHEILAGTQDINIAVGKNSHWKDPVMVMCDFPDPAYPLLFNLERPNDGYFLTGRPVRLFNNLKKVDGLNGGYREFYEHALNVIRDRLDRRSAALVLVHGSYQIDFLVEAQLMQILDHEYDRLDDASYYSDNVEPREYLGYYYAFSQYSRRDSDRR